MNMFEYDEEWYLTTYEDVAAAVKRGDWPSGYMHYCVVGRAKGRQGAPPIDEEWYKTTYPLAAEEVAAGRARGFHDHFYKIGRHRGYLPNQRARRPEHSAGFRSRFGGLWVDHTNALDLVMGRLKLGRITPEQADTLNRWINDGYIIIKQAIPADIVDTALEDMNRAYEGEFPNLKFQVHGVGQNLGWIPEVQCQPTKAVDLHWFSQAIRNLIFAPKVLDFLHLIFERPVLATQTLAFWRGSAQEGHQDSAYVNYSLPMQFAASWIALEDVYEGAGELFYHVGSHQMAEHLYLGRYKGVEDAARVEHGNNHLNQEIKNHVERIAAQAAGMSLETLKFKARKGDVLFWAADLAHGGRPVSETHTRKSVVTHYCPEEIVPSYFEAKGQSPIKSHGGTASYSSGHYSQTEGE